MNQAYTRRRPAFLDTLTAPDFRAVAAQGCFVYCYLRTADGSPYYVGIASQWKRPMQPHDSCGLPRSKAHIRIMRTGLTWEEATRWEQHYIKRWGRKDNRTGILRNRTDGGDGRLGGFGRLGIPHDEETKLKIAARWRDPDEAARWRAANKASWDDERRAKRSADSSALHAATVEANAALVNLSVPDYLALSPFQRHELVKRAQGLMRPLLTAEEKSRIISEAKLKAAAKKLAAGLGLTEDEYIAMPQQERNNLARRIKNGPKPAINPKAKAAAVAYGVNVEWYAGLTAKEKAAFRERVARANKKAADCSAA